MVGTSNKTVPEMASDWMVIAFHARRLAAGVDPSITTRHLNGDFRTAVSKHISGPDPPRIGTTASLENTMFWSIGMYIIV